MRIGDIDGCCNYCKRLISNKSKLKKQIRRQLELTFYPSLLDLYSYLYIIIYIEMGKNMNKGMGLKYIKEYIINEHQEYKYIDFLDYHIYTLIFNQSIGNKNFQLRFNLQGLSINQQDNIKEEDFNIYLAEDSIGLNLCLDLDEVDTELQDHIQDPEVIGFIYQSIDHIRKESLIYRILDRLPAKKQNCKPKTLNLGVLLECFQEVKEAQPPI